MKDTDNYKKETINIVDILTDASSKFKLTRPDIKWQINITDKKTIFKGSYDMWEAIVDNILSNFMRYAEKEIKITVKGHQIIFYNDGPNIDEAIVNEIFSPYRKGMKGQFGLGLSIVRQTVSLLGYDINVRNEKKGISFIIK
ncbi:MAG: ATP-binding protein [Bacilli bacterium]|nr:ATP-binding protein [Bacilli bacterium]